MSVRRTHEEVYMGWIEQLQFFNFQQENVEFFLDTFSLKHSKLLRVTENSVWINSTHRKIKTGENYFLLAKCQT